MLFEIVATPLCSLERFVNNSIKREIFFDLHQYEKIVLAMEFSSSLHHDDDDEAGRENVCGIFRSALQSDFDYKNILLPLRLCG